MKMNLSISTVSLKSVTGFLKKYTALLPSIGIMLVALLLFIPTMVVRKSVKKEMANSVRVAGSVASMQNEVPSKDTPQQVKRYMDRLEDEAKQIETMAVESSMRELISYNVFPPKGTSSQLFVNFGKKYRIAIENLMKAINASDAPGDNEIRSLTGAGTQPGMGEYGVAGYGQPQKNAVNPMIEALCMKRAKEISVYSYPSVFPWYDFWEKYDFAGQDQAVEDCWDAQVAFWIYEDVIETIRKMNEGSQAVSTSPVKRLLGVSFSGPVAATTGTGYSSYGSPRRPYFRTEGAVAFRDKPNYILPPAAAASMGMSEPAGGVQQPVLVSNFMPVSLTSRSGNEDVDVVHFAFSVLVDNRSILMFIKELCSEKTHHYRTEFKEDGMEKTATHNQITILKNEISVVDTQDPMHELYRYGDGAVMQLDLVCEYQFVRRGYDSIKPEPVKKALGQAAATPEGGVMGGTGMPF